MKTTMITFLLTTVLICTLLVPAHTQGFTHNNSRAITVSSIEVQKEITNGTSITTINYVYRNGSEHVVSGAYNLPLSHDACVFYYALTIGEKTQVGKIQDKHQAENTFQNAKSNGYSTSLSKKTVADSFTTSIANIPPHTDALFTVKFSQLIPYTTNKYTIHIPLSTYYNNSNPVDYFSLNISVKDGADIMKVWKDNHSKDLKIVKKSENSYNISTESFDFNLIKDINLFYKLNIAKTDISAVSHLEDSESPYFMLSVIPPTVGLKKEEERLPSNYVFVVDRSGSMAGKKIANARKTLLQCVASIDESKDFYGIVAFDSHVSQIYPENKRQAEAFISREINARGGTDIHTALSTAIFKIKSLDERKDFLTHIILITDGNPSSGISNFNEIINRISLKNKESNFKIHTFGIGHDVNKHFLLTLAKSNAGEYDFLYSGNLSNDKITSFFSKISNPYMRDVEISFSGSNVFDVFPAKQSTIYKGQKLFITGRARNYGDINFTFSGYTNNGKITLTKKFTIDGNNNENIKRIWAKQKIDNLLCKMKVNSYDSNLKSNIIALSKKYNIPTPLTSYVSVSRKPVVKKYTSYTKSYSRNTSAPPVYNTQFMPTKARATSNKTIHVNRNPPKKIKPSFLPLFGLSIPNFNSARKKSRSKACIANIKMLENALEMFDMDNPPNSTDPNVTTVVLGQGENVQYYPLTKGGYVQRMAKCPTSGATHYIVMRDKAAGNALYVVCPIHGTIACQLNGNSAIDPKHLVNGTKFVYKEPGLIDILPVYFYNASVTWITLYLHLLWYGSIISLFFGKASSWAKGISNVMIYYPIIRPLYYVTVAPLKYAVNRLTKRTVWEEV